MSNQQDEFEEASDSELLDDENETEWVGEEEWGDEEEENVALVEEEVPSFIDNGDGTISDTQANLMWKKDDSFKEYGYGINWFEAQDYCEMLNEKQFAGYDDWRLPSGEEARAFSLLRSPIPTRMVQKRISPNCLNPEVDTIPGPMKKNRIMSNMPKNSVLSPAMICGSIKITNIPIAELPVMLFKRIGNLNGEKTLNHSNDNFFVCSIK